MIRFGVNFRLMGVARSSHGAGTSTFSKPYRVCSGNPPFTIWMNEAAGARENPGRDALFRGRPQRLSVRLMSL
jgi:hypothetical protein